MSNKYKIGFKGRMKTLRDMENSYVIIPSGTIVIAERRHGGFYIELETSCPVCKCKTKMGKVPESDLFLVERIT